MSADFSNATARPWELDAVLKIDGVRTQATIYPSFGDDTEKTYEAPPICTLAYADAATWTLDDIRPFVEHSIESFGWNRVVWGSDWPVCTLGASLSTWLAAIQALTQGASADERDRLFARNARRIWRL